MTLNRLAAVTTCALVVVAGMTTTRVTAQVPARDSAATLLPPAGKGRISGRITERDDVPVRRATVTIAGDMRLTRTAVTDTDGRFSVAELPVGRFTVTATKAGHPTMSFGARQPFRTGAGVFLAEGESVDTSFRLPRGAVITGTVRDEHGNPMPDVPLMAWLVRTSLGGQRTLDFSTPEPQTFISDDRGQYRVFGLPAGEYVVGTTWYFRGVGPDARMPGVADYQAAFAPQQPRPPEPARPNPAQFNYAQLFAPSALDPLATPSVRLAAGEEIGGIDILMQFIQKARIEGDIVYPDGKPAPTRLLISRQSSVSALNSASESPGLQTGRVASGGLSPGPYTVFAEVPATADAPALWASQDVNLAPGETTSVTLTLQEAVAMSGTLVFEGKSPLPGDLTRVVTSFQRQGPVWARPSVRTNAEGRFTATGIVPGRYLITASVPAGNATTGPVWRVASVRLGDEDVTDRPQDLGPGAGAVTITFTDVVTELSGRLIGESGEPTAGYFVIAMPEDRAYWLPQSRRIVSTRPDGQGRYTFRGLPPGRYRIAVTTDLVPQDLRDPAILEQLLPQSLPVTVSFTTPAVLDIKTTGVM
jgi:hypothetical protein